MIMETIPVGITINSIYIRSEGEYAVHYYYDSIFSFITDLYVTPSTSI